MATDHTIVVREKNFRARFCAYYRCSERYYERVLFWKCLHRSYMLPVGVFLYLFHRGFFDRDFITIQKAGAARNAAEFEKEVHSFQKQLRHDHSSRAEWRLRISGQRLANIGSKVFSTEP